MKVAEVEATHAAVATLALHLQRAGEIALAAHVGRAVDKDLAEVDLTARECADIARLLDPPPAGLEEVCAALSGHIGARR